MIWGFIDSALKDYLLLFLVYSSKYVVYLVASLISYPLLELPTQNTKKTSATPLICWLMMSYSVFLNINVCT